MHPSDSINYTTTAYPLEGLDAAAEANTNHPAGTFAVANCSLDHVNSESDSDISEKGHYASSQFAKPCKPATPLQATIQLLEVASRIENVVSELQRCTDDLSDQAHTPHAGRGDERSEVISLIHQHLVPFLTLAGQCIIDSATILAPIQGSKVLHSRKDSEWKRRVLEDSKSKHDNRTPFLQLIDTWVTNCYHNTDEFWRKKNRKKTARPRHRPPTQSLSAEPPLAQQADLSPHDSIYREVTSLQQEPPELTSDGKSIVLPIPQNGTHYTETEALSIINRFVNNKRGLAITEMLRKKYVPWGRAKMYDLLKTYNENISHGQFNGGILNEDWGNKGRPKKGHEQNPKSVHNTPVSAKKSEAKYPKILSTKSQQLKVPLESTRRMKTSSSMPPIALAFPPQNGKYYLKSEFLQIVSRYPKSKRNVAGGHCRGQIIKYILQNKLVNTCKSTLYKVLEMWENDPNFTIDNDEWKSSGRTNFFSDDEINKLAFYIHSHRRTYNHTEINNLLVDIARKRAVVNGQDPARIPDKLSKSTVRNYLTIIASNLELLDENAPNEKKRRKEMFRYVDGKLILGRSEDIEGITQK
ncbi:hypothetical protein HJC23_010311 [Cyclotella cryptica]|uniref:Uncharacterized protein n=1 Tax=Cyclotella cryptica TaxID=29204 RepID=A0ABD3QPC4_9STRA|eukprot:CCRYP_003719-RA/>CCRYP_003719-RA protein AED:0.11 eAED:0.11 QI:0/-1/0/1/-1/1/1/0/582